MRLTDITGSPLNKNEFLLDDFYIHDFRGNEFVRSNESFTSSSSLTKKKIFIFHRHFVCTTTLPLERCTRNSCFFCSNNSRTINF